MQIHTFEVSAPLNNENFYKIQKEITSKDKSKWQGEKNGMTYFGLSDKDIIIKMYRIKKKGFYAYSLTYRISARRVIDNDIEIRCMEEKVKALREKYGISNIDEFMANADMIGKDVFNYYLKRMFDKGTIYTLGEARKRIEISEYSQDNCELLNRFLTDATELRSSAKAINMYKEIYGDKEVKRIIYMLDMLKVCLHGKYPQQYMTYTALK